MLASRLAINAERLEEWHHFQTELTNVLNAGVVDISRARAAAAGAHTLARKNTPNSGTRSTDVDAVSKGAGNRCGSDWRIRLNCGKDFWWSKGRNTRGNGRKGNGKGTDQRICPGFRTLSTVGSAENLVSTHQTAEASYLLVEVRLVKMIGSGTCNNGTNSNLNLKLEALFDVCGCVPSVVKRTHRTPTCAQ